MNDMTDLNNTAFPSLKDRVVIITGAGQGIGRGKRCNVRDHGASNRHGRP